jgi:hypothetical protein
VRIETHQQLPQVFCCSPAFFASLTGNIYFFVLSFNVSMWKKKMKIKKLHKESLTPFLEHKRSIYFGGLVREKQHDKRKKSPYAHHESK